MTWRMGLPESRWSISGATTPRELTSAASESEIECLSDKSASASSTSSGWSEWGGGHIVPAPCTTSTGRWPAKQLKSKAKAVEINVNAIRGGFAWVDKNLMVSEKDAAKMIDEPRGAPGGADTWTLG